MPIIYILIGIAISLAVWCGIFVVLAKLGGWAAVAAEYPGKEQIDGRVFRWQYGSFRWVDYNGCLTITLSQDGIGISIWPFFRIRHSPIFLPWSALHVVEVKDRWYGRKVTIDVGDPPITRIHLPLKIMEEAGRLNDRLKSTTDMAGNDSA